MCHLFSFLVYPVYPQYPAVRASASVAVACLPGDCLGGASVSSRRTAGLFLHPYHLYHLYLRLRLHLYHLLPLVAHLVAEVILTSLVSACSVSMLLSSVLHLHFHRHSNMNEDSHFTSLCLPAYLTHTKTRFSLPQYQNVTIFSFPSSFCPLNNITTSITVFTASTSTHHPCFITFKSPLPSAPLSTSALPNKSDRLSRRHRLQSSRS